MKPHGSVSERNLSRKIGNRVHLLIKIIYVSCIMYVCVLAHHHTLVATSGNIVENTGASAGRRLVCLDKNDILRRAR